MHFKNYEDYVAQRNALLDTAEAQLNENRMDEYNDTIAQVEELDTAYEEYARNQANLNALKGSVKAPLSASGRAEIIDSIQAPDQEMAYRVAFMNYVTKGMPITLSNANATTVTTDVGAVIPNTILDRIVEKMEVTGNILNKITRTFYKGGLTVPTSAAKPEASWTTERGTTDKQKKAVGSITFSYYKLKVQVAMSIIVENVTLDVFERTIANNIAEAMTKALESAIVAGDGSGKPKGILAETGVTVEYTDKISYATLAEAEGKLPEAYEDAEWCMKKADFMTSVIGMVDDAGQPIARTSVGIDGKPEYRILGRPVVFSQDATVPFIFRFADYILNTNLGVTVSKYTDQDTDDEVTKAIMLADGKVIDTSSLIKLSKKA